MRGLIVALLTSSALTLGCGSDSIGPSQQPPDMRAETFHSKIPTTDQVTVYDQCTDQWLTAILTMTDWITTVQDESGAYTLAKVGFAVRGTVTAPDGTTYKLIERYNTVTSEHSAGVFSETVIYVLVGRGSLSNEVMHTTRHETKNANGVPVVSFNNTWIDCH